MSWFHRVLLHGVLFHGALFTMRPVTSYRAIELGLSPGWLGVFSASFSLIPLLIAVPVGRWVDRRAEWPVLTAGSALVAVSGAGLVFARDVVSIIVCSAVSGVGLILAMVAAQAVIANHSPAVAYDSRFGFFTLAASAGQLLGPLALSGLAASAPPSLTSAAFTGTAVAALAATLVAASVRPPGGGAPRRRAAGGGDGVSEVLRAPGVVPAMLASTAVLAAIDLITVYLPALGEQRGIAPPVVGLLIAARSLASMASRAIMGALVRWKGRHAVLVASLVLSAVSMGVLAVPLPVWALALALVVAGFALGVGQPLTMAWVADAAAPSARGTAMALRMSGNQLGQIVLPLLAGGLAGGLGIGLAFATFGTGLGAVALVVALPRQGS
ncbi:MFS transporter [Allonocardiopsis opalescens]|uniref:Putative MFS family arabinose efflux permease n=1 Tax=Allonocardiopsis opalescens TaxID=1144618 RepID=A0A2T0PTP8_9ACTN|nr:MFS transporter [Allonocardiopsis opalescens]PRX92272.1 putative MFS family arabinose efflux permease [Allonocardiopsis opalescens]